MFSIIRKLGIHQQTAKYGAFCEAALSGAKFMATTDGAHNSDSYTIRENKNSFELIAKQNKKKTARTLTPLNDSVLLAARPMFPKDEIQEFMAVFPELVTDVTEKARKYDTKLSKQHFIKALQYNVPCGNKIGGMITVFTFKQLVDKTQLTPGNIRLAQYLGWCVEMLQASYLIMDDIVDHSITRRGQPCWYTLEDVGLTAINDSFMIVNGTFHILKKYFSHTDYYMELLDLFHENNFVTCLGQYMDLQIAKNDVTSFTIEKYKVIAYNKTSYFTFYFPVALAMHVAGFTDQEIFRQVKTISLEMGYFHQVQNDFLDCFGDPAITGKIGTDIQDNRCSWLAIVCMEKASNEQKEIMQECYGQNDPVKVARVKQLYIELGLQNSYAIYEEEFYKIMRTHIAQTSLGVPQEIFVNILNKSLRRNFEIQG